MPGAAGRWSISDIYRSRKSCCFFNDNYEKINENQTSERTSL